MKQKIMCQVQSIGFPRIPREEWGEHVGRVVMYATKTDIAEATGEHAYYNGVLEGIREDEATFKYSTWREPEFDYKLFGRETRTLKLNEILEMIPSAFDAEFQREEYLGTVPKE